MLQCSWGVTLQASAVWGSEPACHGGKEARNESESPAVASWGEGFGGKRCSRELLTLGFCPESKRSEKIPLISCNLNAK